MPTNKQRRDAARRHLERQLQRRQEREQRRRKTTLVMSIVGTLVLIAAIVVVVALVNSDTGGKSPAASKPSSTPTTTPATSAATTPPVQPAAACTKATGSTATFDGVTIKNADNLKVEPTITSKVTTNPKTLICADLVVGKGAAATSSSTVSVQYVGALLSNGTVFDASWKDNPGKPTTFSLSEVVPGFTQGIGGAGPVAPMHVGGRRIMILPASLGYGSEAQTGIPANSSLIFVVDLSSVAAASS